jgi:hypothetical protein
MAGLAVGCPALSACGVPMCLPTQVAPTQPGLYFARCLAASLGTYDLRIPVVPAAQLARDTAALAGGWEGAAAGLATGAGGGGPGGGVAAAGGGGLSLGFGGGSVAAGTAAALAEMGGVKGAGALNVAPCVSCGCGCRSARGSSRPALSAEAGAACAEGGCVTEWWPFGALCPSSGLP